MSDALLRPMTVADSETIMIDSARDDEWIEMFDGSCGCREALSGRIEWCDDCADFLYDKRSRQVVQGTLI